MKRIVVFNIVLLMAAFMNASAPVTPVSPLKKLIRYIGIDANSWQQDIMTHLQRDGKNMQKGIEFLQPSERQMKIVGSFWVNPVTYEVVQDCGQIPWNFEIMIDRTDDQFDQVHFKCPNVPYFQSINRIDYVDGYMRFKKSEYEDLKNHVDFLMRTLNPHAGMYKD